MIKHDTASVIIFSDTQPRKTLLVFHKKLQKWIYCGGHVEQDENPYEAAIREAKEETGIDIELALPAIEIYTEYSSRLPSPSYLLEQKIPAHLDQPEHFHIDHVYRVIVPEQSVLHRPSESEHIGWFTYQEIKQLDMFKNLRVILDQEFKK